MKNETHWSVDLPPQVAVTITLQGFRLPDHFPTQYLTADEVAFIFKIHERTVRRWACRGRLRRYCFGHRTFYKRDEIFHLI